MSQRIVKAHGTFGYKYRASVHPSRSFLRRRDGFRYLKEKHFVAWDPCGTSRWFATKQECFDAAHKWLDWHEPPDGGEPVPFRNTES